MPAPITTDMSGKTCVVTGANTGIGAQIARELARLGGTVVLACRSLERGQAALDEIAAQTGSDRLELMQVDLSSQASIRQFAETLAERHPALQVLVNNAGIWPSERTLSADGIELTFATNVLGYFLLTQLLTPLLLAGAPARIVDVASEMAGHLDLEDLQFERRPFDGLKAYAQSKQSNRMLAWARARRLDGQPLTVNVMHPGGVRTEINRQQGGLYGLVVGAWFRLFGKTVEAGADTAVWLAASDEVAGESGKFWVDRAVRRCRFADEQAEERLWRACEALVGR